MEERHAVIRMSTGECTGECTIALKHGGIACEGVEADDRAS
jgi:hypothetical protein